MIARSPGPEESPSPRHRGNAHLPYRVNKAAGARPDARPVYRCAAAPI
jgi:hypothetical protein